MKTDKALVKTDEAPVKTDETTTKTDQTLEKEPKKSEAPVKTDDSKETVGYSDGDTIGFGEYNSDNNSQGNDYNDSNADSNAQKTEEMEKIKSKMNIVFGKEKKDSAKVFIDSNVNVFQKGDHVLVVGVKRKLPAILGDKVLSNESDD